MASTLGLILNFLIFPGLLFTAIVGLLTQWVDRKVSARVQWRVGPPWYQPFADILKLLGKEIVIPEGAKRTGFLLAPVAGLAAVGVVSTMLWLANISGVALIVGTVLLLKSRAAKKDQKSDYWDWYLIYLAFGLGVTGMGTELARLAGWAFICYLIYYIHLMLFFSMIAYLPFSKMAHIVYRTVAMAYNEYAGRNF